MKTRLVKLIGLLGVALVVLSGCATYPVAKNLRRQARPLTLAGMLANPAASRGTVVIWGGKIIKTINDTNGGALYILKLPLGRSEKPLAYANSTGRFIASSMGFLDPEIYARGRLVTVAGTVAGLKTEPVQKTQYTYPAVAIKQIYVWPVTRDHYYYYPAWGWGAYYPGWYWGAYPAWGWGLNLYFPGGDWDRDYHGGHFEGGDRDGGRREGGWHGRH